MPDEPFSSGEPATVVFIDGDPQKPQLLGKRVSPGKGSGRVSSKVVVPISLGQWEQQWGNPTQNAKTGCTFTYSNWPGSSIFTYPTDTGGATGQRTNPQGMAAYPGGYFLLMHRMNTDPSASPVGFKLRVLQPGPSSWSELFAIDVTFSDTKDQSANTYYTDCQMMFDEASRRVTIFSRCYFRFGSGAGSSNLSNVWSIHIPQTAIDNANSALCTVLHTTITTSSSGLRYMMNCANMYGDYLIKANQSNVQVDGPLLDGVPTGLIRGFKHIEGVGWQDLWTLDWKTALKAAVGISSQKYLFHASSPLLDNVDSSNFGPPIIVHGTEEYRWCLTSSIQADHAFDPTAPYNSKLVEMLVDANTGEMTNANILWELGQVLRDSTVFLTDVLAAYESTVQGTMSPTPAWGSTSTTSHTVLMPGGTLTSRNRTNKSIWLGTLTADATINYMDPTANPTSSLWPYFGSNVIGHPPIAAPLPARNKNSKNVIDRMYWNCEVNNLEDNNSRGLSTSDGWRFYAAVIPYGPIGPGGLAASQVFDTIVTDLGVGWTPRYFADEKTLYGAQGAVPQFTFETWIFSVSPTNVVTAVPLLNKHTGVRIFGTPDPTTGHETTIPLPIPDNVWQWLYFPEIDRVVWLHDFRSSWLSDPQPSMTVTDKLLNVKYRIPPADLFTITLFNSNQIIGSGPSAGQVWAYAGQDTRKRHCIDEEGPLMKGFVKNGLCNIILGTESFDFVEPVSGSAGTTYSRTTFLQIGADSHTVLRHSTTTQAWTYPTITSGNLNGRAVMRNLAFLPDRAVFRRGSNSLRHVL